MAPACSLDTLLQELDTKELHSCLIQGRFWLCQQEQLDCQELRLSQPICFGSLHAAHRPVQSKPIHVRSPRGSGAPPVSRDTGAAPAHSPDAPLIG